MIAENLRRVRPEVTRSTDRISEVPLEQEQTDSGFLMPTPGHEKHDTHDHMLV